MDDQGEYDWMLQGDGKCKSSNWERDVKLVSGQFNVYRVKGTLDPDIRSVAVVQAKENTINFDIRNWKILKEIKHERVVEYKGYSRTDRALSVFLDYGETESLARYIKKQQDRRLTEERTSLFTNQILDGVEYLHNKNITHGEIKGSNILVGDDNNVRIADLGLSLLLKENKSTFENIDYMAPERFGNFKDCNEKIDIWSIGCVAYLMNTGETPFKDLATEQIINCKSNRLLEMRPPDGCSQKLKDFLRLACYIDPNNRPSAKELKTHDFVKGTRKRVSSFCQDNGKRARLKPVNESLTEIPKNNQCCSLLNNSTEISYEFGTESSVRNKIVVQMCNELPNKKYIKTKQLTNLRKEYSMIQFEELEALKSIDHRCILAFSGYKVEKEWIEFYIEYQNQVSLDSYIKKLRGLNEIEIRIFTRQILKGLSYLHCHIPQIIHGDIRGENILLSEKNEIKLAGYTISKYVHSNIKYIRWKAPECYTASDYYNDKFDIWGVGCTVVEMSTEKPPNHEFEDIKERKPPKYELHDNASISICNFLERIFKFDPQSRPSANELLGDIFISDHILDAITITEWERIKSDDESYPKLLKIDKKTVALKEIDIENVEWKLLTKKIRDDKDILTRIDHERLIKFYGFVEFASHIEVISEFMPEGTLRKCIDYFGSFNENKALMFTKQIVQGIDHLHQQHLILGGITDENVFMAGENAVKLGGVAVSTFVRCNQDAKCKYPSQTSIPFLKKVRWLAPELMLYRLGDGTYDNKVDIWSVGCLLVRMVTGKPPNSDLEDMQAFIKIIQGEKPSYNLEKSGFKNTELILKKIFNKDPKYRPLAGEMLEFLSSEGVVVLKDIFLPAESSVPYKIGRFGKVYYVQTIEQQTTSIVVKELSNLDIQYNTIKELLTDEENIKTIANHEMLLPFFGFREERNIMEIILKYMEKGTLDDYIKIQGRLLETQVRRFTIQILSGLSHLHEKRILVGDISGRRIYVESDMSVKLGGFGVSKTITAGNVKAISPSSLKEEQFDLTWMAPEMVLYISGDSEIEVGDRRADVWSIGCAVVQMATGLPLTGELQPHQIVYTYKITNREPKFTYQLNASKHMWNFVEKTLKGDPKQRPSANELLNLHSFVSEKKTLNSSKNVQNFDLSDCLTTNAGQDKLEKFFEKHKSKLIEQLDSSQVSLIKSYLYQYNIIDENGMKSIKLAEVLISTVIKTASRRAFDIFLQALRQTCPQLAKLIKTDFEV